MQKSTMVLAMVALASKEQPDFEQFREDFATRWPGEPKIAGFREKDGTATARVGSSHVGITHVTAPIPWRDLEWPVHAADWYWADAETQLRAHESHVIVAVGSEAPKDQLNQHRLATRIIASLLETSDAVGVYWGAGHTVTSKEMFSGFASRVDEVPPTPLWIAIARDEGPDGELLVGTRGLTEFGHLELVSQAGDDPVKRAMWLHDLAAYVIDSGVNLEDGETVGKDDEEKIPVHRRPSPWSKDETVVWVGD